MELTFSSQTTKAEVFQQVQRFLDAEGLTVVSKDFERPWGGFFVIEESQARKFAHLFFPNTELAVAQIVGKLSPKILIVESGKRLSWQYHFRRSEIWKLIGGKAGVALSSNDDQGPVKELALGQIIELAQGQRHRLVGLDQFGVVAEIWRHTDPNHPSDEQDIVRLQDDFGR